MEVLMWIIFSGNKRSEGLVWFRGPSDAPRSARASSATMTQLAPCSHSNSSVPANVTEVLFFFFLLKAFCGAWTGCAAEETIRDRAKPNRFLWVKEKLVVSYYMLCWEEELLYRRGEKIDGFHCQGLFLHTYHTGISVGAFIHFHRCSGWSWFTLSNSFIYVFQSNSRYLLYTGCHDK